MNSKLAFVPKGLIIDVDGTAIANKADAILSERVKQSIRDARTKGVPISLMTGRPLFQAINLFEDVDLTSPSVLHGGAVIANVHTGEILKSYPLNEENLATITERIEPYKANHDIEAISALTYAPLFQAKVKDPVEIYLAAFNQDEADALIQELSLVVSLTAHKLISYTPDKIDISISNALARKDYALFEISNMCNFLPSEAIGIGDGYNDLLWLSHCGLKVAMGNAIQSLKDLADYIAPSVEEDGIAHVIEQFLLT